MDVFYTKIKSAMWSDRKTDPQIAPQVGYLFNTPSALQNSLNELLLFLWSATFSDHHPQISTAPFSSPFTQYSLFSSTLT